MLTLFLFALPPPMHRSSKKSVRTDVTYVGETAADFRPGSVFFERIDARTLSNLLLCLAVPDAIWKCRSVHRQRVRRSRHRPGAVQSLGLRPHAQLAAA
jgi:hypothetical protein